MAHQLLDGLDGLEIGPAAHNPFGLKTRNVGLGSDRNAFDYEFFKQAQLEMCGRFSQIDISADAAHVPLPDNSVDFVLHSHVWEHLPNALVALEEWIRLIKPGGYLFVIVPKRDAALSDKGRPLTAIASLIEIHKKERRTGSLPPSETGSGRGHYTIFSPHLLREIAGWYNEAHRHAALAEIIFQETDDKVGNGHTIVWRVKKYPFLAVLARSFRRLLGFSPSEPRTA
ncbi:MAG TPA: class I SAM-dependent methyltransferase [Chthoniobacterales bacterium]